MANLIETPIYDAGVYRIETTDQVLGGEAGIANKSAKNLANRTGWLKAAVDIINTFLVTLKSAATKDASAVFGAGKVPLWDGVYTKAEIDAKVNAAPIDNHQQVVGVSLITGSGAVANMPDMSVTFTPKGKAILMIFSAVIHTTATVRDCTISLNVAGADLTSQIATIYQQDLVFSLQWKAVISPGVAITALVKWNANSDIQQHGEVSPRVLTIIDLP